MEERNISRLTDPGNISVEVQKSNSWLTTEAKNYLIVGFTLLIVQILLAGYSVVSVRYVKGIRVDIFFIVLCRSLISAVLSLGIALFVDKELVFPSKPCYREILYFVIFGLISTSLNPIMYLQVVSFTSGSFVVILGQLIPMLNIIFSYLFKIDRVQSKMDLKPILTVVGTLIGCGFALAVAGIGFNFSNNVTKYDWLYGTLIGVTNNLTFSLYQILQAKLFYRNVNSVLKNKPFTINAYCTSFGAILYTIIITPYMILNRDMFKNMSKLAAVPILYSSIITSTLCCSLMTWCNRKSSPVVVGTSFSLQVAISLTMLRLFTNEMLYLSQYLCCIGVVVGVLLVILSPTIVSFINRKRISPKII